MQIFPEKHIAKNLIVLFSCIFLIVLIVTISDLYKHYELKKNIRLSLNKNNKTIQHSIHATSTKPFTFDPLSRSSTSTIPQFILLSFDGSKSIDMWKDTISFAENLNASNTPLHFTYFVNSAYFLVDENKNAYKPPNKEIGHSDIGYSESLSAINRRVKEVNNAIERGHEIASHSAGHWLGGSWSIDDWQKEFSAFNELLFNYKKNNPQYNFSESLNLNKTQIKGFRAPSLSINLNMYDALSKDGYYYDSSEINIKNEWPHKDKIGIWHIPISTFYWPYFQKKVLAVDYTIWVVQSNGENLIKKGTAEWDNKVNDLTNAYISQFENNYATNRAPIVIDNHFSTWNDGLYWEALKGFAKKACGRTNVRCTTFSELVDYMEGDTK